MSDLRVSEEFEQVVPGLGPNNGKGLTKPFSAVRTTSILDFGKANLWLMVCGLPSLGHIPY